ncbi:peptidylprolyl isomerase [Flavobacteriaceae bacterium]|nr:peptidylprolyl isomerase [Flavobacteriaceae bacterium]
MKKNITYLILALIAIGCKTKYPELEAGIYADIETNKGSIVVSLEHEKTPVTVANFVSLSEGTNEMVSEEYKGKNFYDGLIFHRVIQDFMIQGGDPLGNGSGNPGYKFGDEFREDLFHKGKGILSMANSGPETNGSQFFITHRSTPWLNGKHTVFGKVVIGENIVDSIAQNDTIKKVTIIRKGFDAKRFDAPTIFEKHLNGLEAEKAEKEERKQLIKLETQDKFEAQKAQAETTESGLQYFFTQKGDGPEVITTYKARTHYAVYLEDGTFLQTSNQEIAKALDQIDELTANAQAYRPIAADCSPEAGMIEGFKEGLRLMRAGDKLTIFVPYTLAYGEQGGQGIGPRSNLIFELEVLEVIE